MYETDDKDAESLFGSGFGLYRNKKIQTEMAFI